MALINESQFQYYSNLGQDFGSYQFVPLSEIIDAFMFVYVGEDKIISKVNRADVFFHAQRALQELSFDTLKSIKSQEITVPNTLAMVLPQDYINYVKLTWSDDAGVEHVIYPSSKTSNPISISQNGDGSYDFDVNDDGVASSSLTTSHDSNTIFRNFAITNGSNEIIYALTNDEVAAGLTSLEDIVVGMTVNGTGVPNGTLITEVNGTTITISNNATQTTGAAALTLKNFDKKSTTWNNFKELDANRGNDNFDYDDDVYDYNLGQRFGIDPQHAQVNGTFYIDEVAGRIHFGSSLSGKTIILKYISDGLGTEKEMRVHKFAEEAMYKHIAYAIVSNKANMARSTIERLKKERRATTRQAKLRLSNIKLEEITQILRGGSKHIKH